MTMRQRSESQDSHGAVSGEPKGSTVDLAVRSAEKTGGLLIHCKRMHTAVREPLISWSETNTSYRGVVNLCILVLVFSNAHEIVANARKYGNLIDPTLILDIDFQTWPGAKLTFAMTCFLHFAYVIETMTHAGHLNNSISKFLHCFNCIAEISTMIFLVLRLRPIPPTGIITMLFACCLFLKLISYGFTRCELRDLKLKVSKDSSLKKLVDEETLVSLEHSPTYGDLLYFWLAPTMCYQTHYPRTDRIRWSVVLRRLSLALLLCSVIFVLAVQYILPLLKNSREAILTFDVPVIIERVLKLALPTCYIWIVGFYVIFHLMLNVQAELLMFGDRRFYLCWWNSTSLGFFWRSWNLPIHNWVVRHMAVPLHNAGCSRLVIMTLVFSFSAIMHEIIVSVPFGTFKTHALLGMFAQLPLCIITEPLEGRQIGNIFFWVVNILVGLPALVCLYFVDFTS